MKELQSYKNGKRATSDLTFGNLANESQSGANDGTPILAEQMQDLYYSLYQVLQLSGNIPNGELEDGNNKKQFIESLCNIGIFKYSTSVSYGSGKIVFKELAGETTFYRSLISENKNVLNDTSAWTELLTIDKKNKINFHVATNIANSGSNLPVFSFNSGPINSDGESALMQYDENTKILTIAAPAVCTTAEGETFTVSENISVDLSDKADGEYIVLYDAETNSIDVCQNQIFIQKTLPESMINGDIFIDVSVKPYKQWRKKNDELLKSKTVQTAVIVLDYRGGGQLINLPLNAFQAAFLNSNPLFKTEIYDRRLSGHEAIGRILEGGLVSSAYSSAYKVVKEAYINGIDTTYRGIMCRKSSEDIYVADVSQKNAIDELYNQTGFADLYILDSENSRFYLPRTTPRYLVKCSKYEDGSISELYSDGCLVQFGKIPAGSASGIIKLPIPYKKDDYFLIEGSHGTSAYVSTVSIIDNETITYSRGNGNVEITWETKGYVDKPEILKQYKYYCVGNTLLKPNYIDSADVINQIENKADLDLGNVEAKASFKNEVSGWIMPDYSKAIRLAVDEPVNGYTVPQNGFIMLNALRAYNLSSGINIYINNVYVGFGFTNNSDISGVTSTYMVSKGDVFKISIKSYAESHMYFIPAKGEISD